MKYIFGPILSRRFGKSLGVDLSGSTKQCNFDCVYCELVKKEPTLIQEFSPEVNDIMNELALVLKDNTDIDVITLTANGEPTMYPHLSSLMDKINGIKKQTKTLILSNASTINDANMQKILLKFDKVKLSLDAVNDKIFKKIDRPHNDIKVADIIKGIKHFNKIFRGDFLIEVLFVKGLNDKDDHLKELNNILLTLNPKRVDIGTIDRPPSYKAKPLTYKELFDLSLKLNPKLPIHIASRVFDSKLSSYYSKETILNTLQKRPLTYDDVNMLFDEKSKNNLDELIKGGKIFKKKAENIEFLTI